MSSTTLTIAKDEWRYWLRSKLATSVLVVGLLLTLSSVIVSSINVAELNHHREDMQSSAQDSFAGQPDRHPHRMVHYGHYAFRTPSALASLDPGVDAFTGNSIFLEGHRQNSAMFADQRQGTSLTKLGSLDPAFIVQNLAPLLLILIGFSSVSREREAHTLTLILAQGTSIYQLMMGKGVALFAAVGMILTPLVISAFVAVLQGEPALTASGFLVGYWVYLSVWVVLIVLCSTAMAKNSASFTTLIFVWILLCIITPRAASTTAAIVVPSAGKLESDFDVIAKLRKIGDGHNASDPAFEQMKSKLLAQYNVDSIEQLPMNFRGAVIKASEAKLTDVLNEFAEKRMHEELEQSQVARLFGWFSPVVAIRSLSMMTAGTSIETHHRFLRETEALRFDFVQSLNTLHEQKLSYKNDVKRYADQDSAHEAQVGAENWQLLKDFNFSVDKASDRLQRSLVAFLQLFGWLAGLIALGTIVGRRVE
ncbi:DUF3526 domain-containing protein [Paraglaciecola sp. 20A4]|uniref:ABC transporter permease n=1 Tax=Paraglaciecola sp. 20A4 TaxID=2687288 RepID=UPI00140D9874|nr:DUF3526 domain-containing protein [Paraglaciecola sp. 20A4]